MPRLKYSGKQFSIPDSSILATPLSLPLKQLRALLLEYPAVLPFTAGAEGRMLAAIKLLKRNFRLQL